MLAGMGAALKMGSLGAYFLGSCEGRPAHRSKKPAGIAPSAHTKKAGANPAFEMLVVGGVTAEGRAIGADAHWRGLLQQRAH
jgi:hypothetical protein